MRNITLIRPPTLVAKWAHTSPTCPPIGMAYLASSLQAAGYHVQVIDATGEMIHQMLPSAVGDSLVTHGLSNAEIIERIDPAADFIALSCMFSHEWPQMKDLMTGIRRRFPRIPIIAGGEHITAVPEYSMESCLAIDFCVLGEGEEIITQLIAMIETRQDFAGVKGILYRDENGIKRTLPYGRIRNIDAIPLPAWELFPLNQYLDNGYGFGVTRGRNMPMIATRGCPYQCTFCSNPGMWTTRWIARDPVKLLEEMKIYIERYQVTNFDFYDLTAVVDRDWVIKFCQMLIDQKLNITWQLPSGTRSEAMDEEVTSYLYRSGCRNLSYAPESGSPEVLKRIKKKVQLPRMLKSMRGAIRAGINIKANIIIGFPDEKHHEIWETLWFIARMAFVGVHDTYIATFSPYPGSELFTQMQKDGQIQELSEEYFLSLTSYTDIFSSVSYSKFVSSPWIRFYRVMGNIMFYLLSYVIRPWRVAMMVYHLIIKKHESRLEMSLHDLLERLMKKTQINKMTVPRGV